MRRVAILLAAAAVTAGSLGGCGSEPDEAGTTPAPGARPPGVAAAPAGPTARTISIAVTGGQAIGDTGQISVPLGTPLVVTVNSDVADEIHVRGYDRKAPVPAGATASVTFIANKPGTFDVALENSKLTLVQLQVS
jgi:heme/copper-type cytochrome/quinol oxidase subunit 2